MKSAGNRGVVQSRLQVLHVHVFLASPLGARHMAQPRADQHQGGVAVREGPNHPYALSMRKLRHLGDIAKMSSSESFMLERISTDTQNYKFGTTDLHFTLCMGKPTDAEGNVVGDCFVVESLRDEDCFSKSADVFAVTHILSKSNDAKKYTDILFMDAAATLDDFPNEVKQMLSNELLEPIKL